MSKIEQGKQYMGHDLETIFFRPMLTGPGARELGIKVMYNMPVPTTLHFWRRSGDILQKFDTAGWHGSTPAQKYQKTIELNRLKAEVSYGASDYFNMVFENITNRSDVNMEDLTGTALEEAETALFRTAIFESIRGTMWLGDTSRGPNEQFATFNGFVSRFIQDIAAGEDIPTYQYNDLDDADGAEGLFKTLWDQSSAMLRESKPHGQLVYLVTSDIVAAYEESLDSVLLDTAYQAKQNGREGLSFRGIPVIDIQVSEYLPGFSGMPQSFGILTDRRNLALAVNTSDFPGTEIKMWYNPDVMENRQRAVFMIGCDYLLPELVSFAYQV